MRWRCLGGALEVPWRCSGSSLVVPWCEHGRASPDHRQSTTWAPPGHHQGSLVVPFSLSSPCLFLSLSLSLSLTLIFYQEREREIERNRGRERQRETKSKRTDPCGEKGDTRLPPDALAMPGGARWCPGGALVVRLRCPVPWWCAGGALVVRWRCLGDALVAPWWCPGVSTAELRQIIARAPPAGHHLGSTRAPWWCLSLSPLLVSFCLCPCLSLSHLLSRKRKR